MPRINVINIGVLNIKTRLHKPENYIKLFQTIHKSKELGVIRGASAGILGELGKPQKMKNEVKYMQGIIYKFLNIEAFERWLDLQRRKAIEVDKEAPIVPEHLKPNLKEIPFVFYPTAHRLTFDTKHITPKSAKILFDSFCSQSQIISDFGLVDVVVHPRKESLKKILKMQKMTKLSIKFSIPNDDVFEADLIEKVFETWKNRNTHIAEINISSTHEDGINIDEELEANALIGEENGIVIASGIEQETKVQYSTADKPLVERIEFDPSSEGYYSALLRGSVGALASIGRLR